MKKSGFALLEKKITQRRPQQQEESINSQNENLAANNPTSSGQQKTYTKHLRDFGGCFDIPEDYYSSMSCGSRVFPINGRIDNDIEKDVRYAIKKRRTVSKNILDLLKNKLAVIYNEKFPHGKTL